MTTLVLEEQERPGRLRDFFILDLHHHIGKEEKVKNLNPTGPDGSLYFQRSILWGNQWKMGLLKELEENKDEFRYHPPPGGKGILRPHPALSAFMDPDWKPFGQDLEQVFANSYLGDLIVAFPMCDTYRDKPVEHYESAKRPTPLYAHSNERIIEITSRFPSSLRFVPFGRVVPSQQGYTEEMDRAVSTLGVRGFKLHPKSDGYSMSDQCVADALQHAASLDVPVIFHTSFLSEAEDLEKGVDRAIAKMVTSSGLGSGFDPKSKDRQQDGTLRELRRQVRRLRVIIGHCGWHTSEELFKLLRHPCIYGEVSGVKGEVIKRFFSLAQSTNGFEPWKDDDPQGGLARATEGLAKEGVSEALVPHLFTDPATSPQYHGWSSKVCYGTDFPFLDQNQAIDVLKAVLSVDFPGNAHDVENFLGLNALRIIGQKNMSPTSSQIPPTLPTPPLSSAKACEGIRAAMEDLEKRGVQRTKLRVTYQPTIDTYPRLRVHPQGFSMEIAASDKDDAPLTDTRMVCGN